MGGRYYFLLTSLPELPDLGAAPPMELSALRGLAEGDGDAPAVIDAILLERDLVARQAVLAGEIESPEGVVLTTSVVRAEEPLSEFLPEPVESTFRIGADAMWEAYFRYVTDVGRRAGCQFLLDWPGFELALRNALVERRSKVLQLDPAGYLVAEDLARPELAVEEAVTAWSAAGDALAAQRALDQARWRWCEEHARYYSFAIDELAAYARKLVLVARWHEMARPSGRQQDAAGA